MASRFFVVTSGYRAEEGELGDRKVTLVELSKERVALAESLKTPLSVVALEMAGESFLFDPTVKYGPHAWEKDSLDAARSFAAYRCDYPGSDETCRYVEILS